MAGFMTCVDYSLAFGAFSGSIFFVVDASNLTRKQTFIPFRHGN
ncbi:putative holin [Pantoea conspicua]|nr:putative holin [Pantoea conspicua]